MVYFAKFGLRKNGVAANGLPLFIQLKDGRKVRPALACSLADYTSLAVQIQEIFFSFVLEIRPRPVQKPKQFQCSASIGFV